MCAVHHNKVTLFLFGSALVQSSMYPVHEGDSIAPLHCREKHRRRRKHCAPARAFAIYVSCLRRRLHSSLSVKDCRDSHVHGAPLQNHAIPARQRVGTIIYVSYRSELAPLPRLPSPCVFACMTTAKSKRWPFSKRRGHLCAGILVRRRRWKLAKF